MTAVERFETEVLGEPELECWLWTDHVDSARMKSMENR